MRGRDREGGGDEAPSAKVLLRKDPRSEAAFVGSPITKKCRACCTPLPVPPPHGGRERCGTALPNHRPHSHTGSKMCASPALPRGRTENVFGPGSPIQVSKSQHSVVKEPGAVGGELQIDKRKSAPVSASGQGIALVSFLPSPSLRGRWRADKAHGLDRQAGGGPLCDGPGREASRPAPCGAPTRHLRLTPQSAIGPHQELFVPGGLIPRPPVGQACVSARPQVAAPVPRSQDAS